ncbi:SDR family NAD(P)-dependent oxidoreductase [Streptomyces malaysiensis]|uniref:SDR family NAD(P)-dependent oxidoreductase n=1 Tax=Streptomyces malaysiensis TaxID=92644 RepID=UPI0020C60973|nr:SDR family NAD(P)-dependent oxidoreductase [Streptomyces samsunensis]
MVPALSAGHQEIGGAGTVALVTGASSGIGEGTALALAALGARVTVVARRADRLDALVEKIKGTGGHALAVGADITDEGQAHASVARTVETYGRLDTVVANAGVMLLGPITGADNPAFVDAQSEVVGAAAGGDEVDGDSVGLDVGGRHGGGGEVWRPALSPRRELPARGLNVPSAQHQHRPAPGPSAAKEVSKSWSGRIPSLPPRVAQVLPAGTSQGGRSSCSASVRGGLQPRNRLAAQNSLKAEPLPS